MTNTPKDTFDTSTAAPKGSCYLELGVNKFLTAARMFQDRRTASNEVLSKAVMLTVQPDMTLLMEASDGVMGMRSSCPITDVMSGFPQRIVVDMNTLYRIAQMRSKSVYLVADKMDLFVDFFGGRVFVPQYNVPVERLQYKEDTSDKADPSVGLIHAVTGPLADSFEIHPDRMMEALSSASSYLPTCTIPDLAFLNMTPEAIYMANGSSVFKMTGQFAKMKLRKGDLDLITSAVASDLDHVVLVRMSKDRISFSSTTYAVQVPYYDFPFSDSYLVLAAPANGGYYLPFEVLNTIVSIMERSTQDAGSVTFRSDGRSLVAESHSREGKRSHVTLVRSEVAVPRFSVSVSTKSALASMKSLKGSGTVCFGVTGPNLIVSTEMSVLVLFGKNVQ